MGFDVWGSSQELDGSTSTPMPILAIEHIDMAPPEPPEIHDLLDSGDTRALRTTIAELCDKAFVIRPVDKPREKLHRRHGEAVGQRQPCRNANQHAMTRRPVRAEPAWHAATGVNARPTWRLAAAGGVATQRATITSIEKEMQLMVKVGDRIRLSSTKGPDRDGVVTAVTGSLLRVRWPSDEETTVVPAPGTLSVLAASDAVTKPAPPTKGARKKAATATKSTSDKKATPDDTRSQTGAAKRPSR
jgi:hypothetical protein